jgi:Fur family ferric uptake transcriptional regulator
MTKGSHDCSDELRNVDLRVTPQRLAVLKVLEDTNMPIDIATIINYLEANDIKADPATVFRIINSFTDKGITKQIQLNEGKFRYEHSSKKDHHHLICESCGKIEDVSDNFIAKIEKEIMFKKKFLTKRHSLEFFGVCKQCQR